MSPLLIFPTHFTILGLVQSSFIYPFSCRLDCRLMPHASLCLPSSRYSHKGFSYDSFCTNSHRARPETGNRRMIAWTDILIFFFGHILPTDVSGLVLSCWVSSSASETGSQPCKHLWVYRWDYGVSQLQVVPRN